MKIPLIELEKERRQTAKALQESEARYQELADSITDIFFALDKELKFTYWNKTAENLTRIPINEALGKSVYEIFREISGTQMEKVSLKVLETQQPQSFVQLYPLNGKPAFFEINIYPSREGFSVFAKDITYRKQMEDALKKSWDYLENLNNSLGDAIFTVNLPDQAIEYVNQAVENIFGYTIEECIGENTRVFFPEKKEYLGFIRKLREAIEQKKDILRTEQVLKRKNGERFTAEITTTFFNENEELTGIISIVRDITHRKQMELALEQERASLARKVEERTTELVRINAELSRASQLKDEFLANMSHDLRTPLNAILGYAKILKKTGHLSQLQQEGLNTIQTSGEHLLNLINDILDLSKIEAGRLELHLSELYLPEFLRQIANIIRIRAEQKGIAFTYENDPHLPVGILTDEKRLREVLINLLDNAVKFTEKGKVRLNVYELHELHELGELETQKLRNSITLHFEVEDTGPGVASQHLETIFLPFHQEGRLQHATEGTGLGLTISQQIVKIMGGELHIRSTEGEGSTFWFDLTTANVPKLSSQMPSRSPEIRGYIGKQQKVLIVDDKRENRAVLMNMLLPLGFEIIEVGNGHACLDVARDVKPDVILLDLRMPRMDGFETATRIRELPELCDLVIIAISASVFEKTKRKSLRAGCNDFLAKPLKEEQLLECLQTHLEIEWIYHDNFDPPSSTDQYRFVPSLIDISLPREEIDILRKFAVCGNITRILKQLEKIEGFGDEFLPLVTELRKLAKSFQVKQILKRLEELE